MLQNPSSRDKLVPPAAPLDDLAAITAERAALAAALHSLLEILPQSYSGRENIKLLCQTILAATPYLRFVWVGFSKKGESRVAPYAATGDCIQEASDWHLPAECFNAVGPYSQNLPEKIEQPENLHPLFTPWSGNPAGSSVSSALAIPLRSDNRGLQGMIVFYTNSADYFATVGVDLFHSFCHVAEIIWKQSNLMRLLTQKTQLDPLTGMMSRRHMMPVLEKMMAESAENGQPLSIMLCRINDFRKFNDLYGWAASDSILVEFAKELSGLIRPDDHGGRWNGVEFLFILPGTAIEDAETVAQRVREHFALNPVTIRNWVVRIELSIGVAQHLDELASVEDLVMQASMNMESGSEEPTPHFF